jgi:DNA-binding transcriptional ArsR family regulator
MWRLELLENLVEHLEASVPDATVPIEPFVQLAQRFGAEPVDALLRPRLDAHPSGLSKDLEVLRDLGLVEVEPIADLADGVLAGAEELDDPIATGLSKGGKGLDHMS